MTMQVTQQRTQSANRAARLRFALQMAEQAQKVGDRITQEREKRKWSRPEMARQMPGVSTGNDVYRWENGKHLPRADTLEAIADLFEIEVCDLYAGPVDDAEPEPKQGDLDQLSGPVSRAELEERVGPLRSGLAEVRGELSGVRTELQQILSLLQRDERDPEETGT